MLQDAFARLGRFIAMAHAKDVLPPLLGSDECRRVAAGDGMLDYPEYLWGLAHLGFQGPLVMHDLAETEVEKCGAMLRRLLPAGIC
jgi:sugar phosphate isomerase/epimerase